MGDLSEHFDRSEFACQCGCGQDTVDAELLAVLEEIRGMFGPVTINSGNRCIAHNRAVGGGEKSQHLTGRAADIVVKDTTPAHVQDYIALSWPMQYGLGRYDDFTHIDTRTHKARWTG